MRTCDVILKLACLLAKGWVGSHDSKHKGNNVQIVQVDRFELGEGYIFSIQIKRKNVFYA